MRRDCDLSAIIPFSDDEERVGALIRRVAAHLEARGVRHEILAVDEGACDNSDAIVAWLRERMPALRLYAAPAGAGFAAGARVARGRVLWLWDAALAAAPVGAFGWAEDRLAAGAELVVVPGRYTLCRRTAAWQVLERARGRGAGYQQRLARLATRRKLRVVSAALRA